RAESSCINFETLQSWKRRSTRPTGSFRSIMRIIVWGINYSPELTGIAPFNAGLCDHLKNQGHDVEMVTAFPYYPFWKKIDGDTGRLYRTDDFNGVPMHRCWEYVA